jgi:CheY-like chemotaxis protein
MSRKPKTDARILIADDVDLVRDVLQAALKRADFSQIDLATNGDAALKLSQENDYDVVILDQDMGPGRKGTDVAAELARVSSKCAPKPLTFLFTGRAYNFSDPQNIPAGVDYVVDKMDQNVIMAYLDQEFN